MTVAVPRISTIPARGPVPFERIQRLLRLVLLGVDDEIAHGEVLAYLETAASADLKLWSHPGPVHAALVRNALEQTRALSIALTAYSDELDPEGANLIGLADAMTSVDRYQNQLRAKLASSTKEHAAQVDEPEEGNHTVLVLRVAQDEQRRLLVNGELATHMDRGAYYGAKPVTMKRSFAAYLWELATGTPRELSQSNRKKLTAMLARMGVFTKFVKRGGAYVLVPDKDEEGLVRVERELKS